MAPKPPEVVEKKGRSVPKDLVCPITFELLKDPVDLDPCGHTFSKEAIEHWFKKIIQPPHCPCCRAEVDKDKERKPNEGKEAEITEFLKPFADDLLREHEGDVSRAILFSVQQNDDENDYYKHMPKQLGVNSENDKGEPALWLAFQEGNKGAFDVLLSCGASLKPVADHLIREHGNNPAQAILTLIRQGDQVNYFYKGVPHHLGIDVKNNAGETALLIALREGDKQSFDTLTSLGATLDTITDNHSLLILAIQSNNRDLIKIVLRHLIEKEIPPLSESRGERINGILIYPSNERSRYLRRILPLLVDEAEESDYTEKLITPLRLPFNFINKPDENGHTPLSSALALNDASAALMLYFGAKTIHQGDDGTYYDVLDDDRRDTPLIARLTEGQFYSWACCRAINYIEEKNEIIRRYGRSNNIFYKIWGFILSIVFNRKFSAACSLRDYCFERHYSTRKERVMSSFQRYHQEIRHFMFELTSGELGRTVFKPYLKYAQQRGLFNPRHGERPEKAWLRSERERHQARLSANQQA